MNQPQQRHVMLLKRTKQILSQDRTVLDFHHYTPSKKHVERMKVLAQNAPELYNNPNITPRSKWFQHKKWNQNSQMPPFHVHFRFELQSVIKYLYQATTPFLRAADDKEVNEEEIPMNTTPPNPEKIYSLIQNAHSIFTRSMRGLNGHVRIEEYACFPLYADTFPKIDIDFLHEEHEKLHKSEEEVYEAFKSLKKKSFSVSSNNSDSASSNNIVKSDDVLSTLEIVLDFDDQLMAHLGEEEEVVVPLSLTEKPIWF